MAGVSSVIPMLDQRLPFTFVMNVTLVLNREDVSFVMAKASQTRSIAENALSRKRIEMAAQR